MKFTLKDYVFARARWAVAGVVLTLLGGLAVFLLAILVAHCDSGTFGKIFLGLCGAVLLISKAASSDSR
jgi:hypothetical protein